MNVSFIHGKLGIKLEQARVVDELRPGKLLCDVVNGVRLIDRDGNGLVLPAKGQNLRCAYPDQAAQGQANQQRQRHPNTGSQKIGNAKQAFSLFPAGTPLLDGAGSAGDGRLFFTAVIDRMEGLLRRNIHRLLRIFRLIILRGSRDGGTAVGGGGFGIILLEGSLIFLLRRQRGLCGKLPLVTGIRLLSGIVIR